MSTTAAVEVSTAIVKTKNMTSPSPASSPETGSLVLEPSGVNLCGDC